MARWSLWPALLALLGEIRILRCAHAPRGCGLICHSHHISQMPERRLSSCKQERFGARRDLIAPLSNSLLMRHSDEIAPARLARSCGGLNCRECLRRRRAEEAGVVARVQVGRAT